MVVEWWKIVVAVICIFLSGTFSGLTLGLMSLDLIDLRVLTESGTTKEKWCAYRILPMRRHGNWLLCTLLIGNTSVNAALAIVTADLFGGIGGFLASTFIILYLGEIIPQAVCHRFGLIIGAYTVPFIRVLMYVSAPLSFPSAKALDYVLGGEPATRYNRSQLKSLVSMHGTELFDREPQSPSRTAPAIVSPDPKDNESSPNSTSGTVVELHHDVGVHPHSDSALEVRQLESPIVLNAEPTVNPNDAKPSETNVSLQKKRFNLLSRLNNLSRNRNSRHPSPKSRNNKDNNSTTLHPPLTKDEMAMLDGAFDFSQKTIGQVMTSLDNVFMLDAAVSLNFQILLLIFQSGHSRVPIYSESRENIIGILFAKDLILLDPEDGVPIRTVLSFFDRTVLLVQSETRLNKMLNIFCQGGGHMAIVRKEHESDGTQTVGVVTLEDLIEELIGQDIVDETDVYMNNLSKQRVKRIRSIDPEVLRMFDSTHDEEMLSEKEVLVVASYLSNNTHEFSAKFVSIDVLREVLAENPIMECHSGEEQGGTLGSTNASSNQSQSILESREITNDVTPARSQHSSALVEDGGVNEGEGEARDDTLIYSKGVPSKNAYLIIHGRLQITAGNDGFVSEAGPWTLLGVRALTDNLYAPDFTAIVIERPTRLLRISRKLYRLMLHASGRNQRDSASGEPLRPRNEERISERLPLRSIRSQNSFSSRSTPSLAVAAAAAAVAVGSRKDSHGSASIYDPTGKLYRSRRDRGLGRSESESNCVRYGEGLSSASNDGLKDGDSAVYNEDEATLSNSRNAEKSGEDFELRNIEITHSGSAGSDQQGS